ncbi:MAG: hypothetical protein IJF65_05110 [Clostridia bacterium]|nr:hypothetical protein [Clostridia bacterium]
MLADVEKFRKTRREAVNEGVYIDVNDRHLRLMPDTVSKAAGKEASGLAVAGFINGPSGSFF